jgi:hypothetical protein
MYQLLIRSISSCGAIGMASDKELSAQAALAEFAALRTEVLQAFSTQWNILALQLTATAVLFSFSLTSHTRTGFLLIVPIVSYILNGRYLRGERLILLASRYIMTEISPRVHGGLNWENWMESRAKGPYNYILWIAYGPSVFALISMVALAWVGPYVFHASSMPVVDNSILEIIWVLDLLLTLVSIYSIWVVWRIWVERDKS